MSTPASHNLQPAIADANDTCALWVRVGAYAVVMDDNNEWWACRITNVVCSGPALDSVTVDVLVGDADITPEVRTLELTDLRAHHLLGPCDDESHAEYVSVSLSEGDDDETDVTPDNDPAVCDACGQGGDVGHEKCREYWEPWCEHDTPALSLTSCDLCDNVQTCGQLSGTCVCHEPTCEPETLACYLCAKEGGVDINDPLVNVSTFPRRTVKRTFVSGGNDPTEVYVLACGHGII